MGNIRKLIAIYILCLGILLASCSSGAAESADLEQQTEVAAASFERTEESTVPETALGTTSVSPNIPRYIYTGSKETLKTDGLTYFVFQQTSETHSDERGDPLLLEVLTKASFQSECPIQTTWVNEILAELQASDQNYGTALLEYAKEDQKALGDAFYYHSHYVSRGIARHDDRVISLLSKVSVYSGGDNPHLYQTALNLDLHQLKSLTLEDVIVPEQCNALFDALIDQIEKKFSVLGDSALAENYQTIAAEAVAYGKMTPYWYFNQQGLVLYFNQYELAQNAAGIIKIELPYDSLEGIIKETYLPKSAEGWISNVAVEREVDHNRKTYEVKLSEGEPIYITLKGTATRVQLSEVRFAEQTAVASTMLFSANRLDDTTTLEITANPDPNKIYAVEYYDESGGPRILYLQDNQVITDLKK